MENFGKLFVSFKKITYLCKRKKYENRKYNFRFCIKIASTTLDFLKNETN